MTENEFKNKIDRYPEQDDLKRVNCKCAGGIGHRFCGWCERHDTPRFECGCQIKLILRRK